jgi:hypothetical protein
MEAIFSLLAFIALTLLAFRMSEDRGPGVHSRRHQPALSGMTLAPPSQFLPVAEPKPESLQGNHLESARAPIKHTALSSFAASGNGQDRPHYPVLDAIDLACGPNHVPFTSEPDAANLERHARALTDAFWSDSVWLTGVVHQAMFDFVVEELERERQVDIGDGELMVFMAPDQHVETPAIAS